jgi:hypothetical protein
MATAFAALLVYLLILRKIFSKGMHQIMDAEYQILFQKQIVILGLMMSMGSETASHLMIPIIHCSVIPFRTLLELSCLRQ